MYLLGVASLEEELPEGFLGPEPEVEQQPDLLEERWAFGCHGPHCNGGLPRQQASGPQPQATAGSHGAGTAVQPCALPSSRRLEWGGKRGAP